MRISDHYDEISHCNRCGFCQVACPIFRSTGHESGVARGRLALLRAIIEKRMEWSKDTEEPLFDCLLCGACTVNCFPAIPTSDLLVTARSDYLDAVGRKPIHRLLFEQLLPYPNRLHWAAHAVALGQSAGIADLAEALGLLRIFGKNFAEAANVVGTIPAQSLRNTLKPGLYPGHGRAGLLGYFVGCGIDTLQQKVGISTFRIMLLNAKSVLVLDNCCCGMPAWAYGDLRVAQKLAEKNMKTISESKVDLLVTDCSSCASFLKKYNVLVPEAYNRYNSDNRLSASIKDFVEWYADEKKTSNSCEKELKVSYHDPCHATRGQNLQKAPREILKNQQNIQYEELSEADWCCGGAGAYALSHYQLAQSVLDRKMENLKKTSADVLATSCPACMIQLSYGVRKHGLSTRVSHLSEVLAGFTPAKNPLTH